MTNLLHFRGRILIGRMKGLEIPLKKKKPKHNDIEAVTTCLDGITDQGNSR